MKIDPTDLGEGYAKQVIVRRTKATGNILHTLLFRVFFWRSTGLSDSSVNYLLAQIKAPITWRTVAIDFSLVIIPYIFGLAIAHYVHPGHPPPTALPLVGIPLSQLVIQLLLFSLVMLFFQTRRIWKQFFEPVTVQQAVEMRQYFLATPAAATAYAYLVQEVAQAENIVPAAQPLLRDALRFMGEAVYQLNSVTIPQWETHVPLPTWISQVIERSRNETDPVVKEALLREAESYRQVTIAAENNAVIQRRRDALLQALFAQIEALRLTLPTLSKNDVSIAKLSELRQDVQSAASQVASQFDSLVASNTTLESSIVHSHR